MEETIQTRVAPEVIWAFWEQGMNRGQTGRFKYQILDQKRGETFSLLWKTLFVRLIFRHSVRRITLGSEICYRVEIKGLFAAPVRWLLGNKIRQNLRAVLKAIVQQLEKGGDNLEAQGIEKAGSWSSP